MARLEMVSGRSRGEKVDILSSGLILGSGEAADIVLQGDEQVRAEHARVIEEPSGTFWIEDLGTECTFLNLVQVQRARLENKDLIFLGTSTVVRFHAESADTLDRVEHERIIQEKDEKIRQLRDELNEVRLELVRTRGEAQVLRQVIDTLSQKQQAMAAAYQQNVMASFAQMPQGEQRPPRKRRKPGPAEQEQPPAAPTDDTERWWRMAREMAPDLQIPENLVAPPPTGSTQPRAADEWINLAQSVYKGISPEHFEQIRPFIEKAFHGGGPMGARFGAAATPGFPAADEEGDEGDDEDLVVDDED